MAAISSEQFMELMLEQSKTNTAILDSIKELQKRNAKEDEEREVREDEPPDLENKKKKKEKNNNILT
jgi:hypothetical protein